MVQAGSYSGASLVDLLLGYLLYSKNENRSIRQIVVGSSHFPQQPKEALGSSPLGAAGREGLEPKI